MRLRILVRSDVILDSAVAAALAAVVDHADGAPLASLVM